MTAPVDARVRLADAHLYLCTDARQRQGDLEQFLDAALAGGVDIVQLRQKDLEARQELACLEVVADVAARHGALVSVNDRADIARAFGADVLHLGQDDLPVDTARAQVGRRMLLGLSTHTRHQVETAATQPTVDYFCVGRIWPTPTRPGRSAPGLDLTRYTARLTTSRPWFAIGGIDLDTVEQVRAAGARRAVVVRANHRSHRPRRRRRRAGPPPTTAQILSSRRVGWLAGTRCAASRYRRTDFGTAAEQRDLPAHRFHAERACHPP